MTDSLLPDLPSALAVFIQSVYPEEELARRALLAPWPLLGFCWHMRNAASGTA